MIRTTNIKGGNLATKKIDFDFDKNTLHIRGTKTTTSDRVVPMSDKLLALLLPIKQKIGRLFNLKSDFVTGKIKDFIPKHKLHNLRHTFATRCLENGVNMKTLQLWLGHSTYEQTANTYSHILDSFNQSEIDKLNK